MASNVAATHKTSLEIHGLCNPETAFSNIPLLPSQSKNTGWTAKITASKC